MASESDELPPLPAELDKLTVEEEQFLEEKVEEDELCGPEEEAELLAEEKEGKTSDLVPEAEGKPGEPPEDKKEEPTGSAPEAEQEEKPSEPVPEAEKKAEEQPEADEKNEELPAEEAEENQPGMEVEERAEKPAEEKADDTAEENAEELDTENPVDAVEGDDHEAPNAPANPEPALTDEEVNQRWRRGRHYVYDETSVGPAADSRRSLLQLIEQLATRIDYSPQFLLNSPRGRGILNRYLRRLTVYSPEMKRNVEVAHVAPLNAHDYKIRSPHKPHFNRDRLSMARIYELKGMPLDRPELNLIFTGDRTGSWPSEPLYVNSWTVLEAEEENVPSTSGYRRPPSDDDERPRNRRADVHCSRCGAPVKCPRCL